MNELVEGVYQHTVPIPYDLKHVNCYLIKGSKGYTLVDTGDYTDEAIAVWEKTLGDTIPIERVVVTHLHTDHVGLAGWFQKEFNVPVFISSKSYDEWKRKQALFKEQKHTSPLSSLCAIHGYSGVPSDGDKYNRFESYQFEPTDIFEENEKIPIGDDLYEAIWTPGHAPDHFTFYNQDKEILFVGDHILNSINPIVMAQKHGDNPLKGYLQSLDRLEKLSVKWTLPSHGELIDNLPLRIKIMKAHYEKRWKEIYQAIEEGSSSAFEITQRVYDRSKLSSERFMSAFIQTITNLIYLESIGDISMEERNGKIYYVST